MSAALDLGSSEFRSLRREDQRLIARRMPAIYTVLDDLPEHRRLLEQTRTAYSLAAGSIVVIGEAAYETSRLLSRPVVPLLHGGELGADDPIGRQVCAQMISLLLPASHTSGNLCAITLPAGATSTDSSNHWTCQFLQHVVQLQGYDSMVMNSATALSLAELEDDEFTGGCLTIGAESITFSLTFQSRPVVEARLKKGVRPVLEQFAHARKKYLWDGAGNSYLDLSKLQRWLQSGDLSLVSPQSEDELWLRSAFEETLLSAWFALKRKIASCHETLLSRPLPIVISGAVTQLTGFTDVVRESIELSGIPLEVQGIRVASFDPYSVARGLLIQAALTSGGPVRRQEVDAA